MGMVLCVLGWLGKLLALLLLCLLALLFLALFFPVFYRAHVSYEKELQIQGRALWLGGLFFLRFGYEREKPSVTVRLFGIDIMRFLERRRKKKEKRAARSDGQNAQEPAVRERTSDETTTDDVVNLEKREPLEAAEAKEAEGFDGADEKRNRRRQSRRERCRQAAANVRQKISGIFEKIRAVIRRLKKRQKSLRRRISWLRMLKAFVTEENTKQMVCILRDNMLHLWRKLRPKKIVGRLEFGFEEPDRTGQALGLLAVFYRYDSDRLQIIPDFEEKKLCADLSLRGHFSVITLIIVLVRIFMGKEWKQFSHKANQLKEATS